MLMICMMRHLILLNELLLFRPNFVLINFYIYHFSIGVIDVIKVLDRSGAVILTEHLYLGMLGLYIFGHSESQLLLLNQFFSF